MQIKPYPKYKDSNIPWIGKIPDVWRIERYKIRFQYVKGKIPENPEETNKEGYLPYLNMEYLRGNEEGVLYAYDPKSIKVNDEDLLLLWDGSNAGEFVLGKKGYLSSTMVKLNVKKINSNFSWYLCKSLEPLLRDLTIGMGIPHVSRDILENIRIPIPYHKEQAAIANLLHKKTAGIGALIEKDKRLIELLKEKRTALINHAVTKGLPVRASRTQTGLYPNANMKDSRIEWIGKIPEGWEVHKIKYNIYEKKVKDTAKNPSTKFIGLEHIESETGKLISSSTLEEIDGESIRFKENDVLFGKLRPYLAKVVKVDFRGSCTGELIVYEAGEKIDSKYLFYRFLSKAFIDLVNSTTYGVKMPRADPTQLSNIKIAWPSLPEQAAIANFLDKVTTRIDKTIHKIQKKINLLEEYKKSLIHHTVTGKIDIRGSGI